MAFDPLAPKIDLEFFGITDIGRKRKANEDNFLIGDLQGEQRSYQKEHKKWRLGGRGAVFAVCDGMGGAAAGEVASEMAVENLFEGLLGLEPGLEPHLMGEKLDHAIQAANHRIFELASKDESKKGMGTTVSAAVSYGNILFLGQVGDSRAYLFRGGQLTRVTKDQSLLERLIEEGAISPEHAENFVGKNVILQALGPTPQVLVDLKFIELEANDVVMLCSDGLHGPVLDDQLLKILQANPNVQDAGQALIDAANQNGGPDNISAIVIRFTGPDLPAPDKPTQAIPQPVKYVRAPIDAITLRLEKELGLTHWLNKYIFAPVMLAIYATLLLAWGGISVWQNRSAIQSMFAGGKVKVVVPAGSGRLVVTSDVPSATLYIDGKSVGQLDNGGKSLIISARQHKITIKEDAWESKPYIVKVGKGRTSLLEINREASTKNKEWLPGRDPN